MVRIRPPIPVLPVSAQATDDTCTSTSTKLDSRNDVDNITGNRQSNNDNNRGTHFVGATKRGMNVIFSLSAFAIIFYFMLIKPGPTIKEIQTKRIVKTEYVLNDGSNEVTTPIVLEHTELHEYSASIKHKNENNIKFNESYLRVLKSLLSNTGGECTAKQIKEIRQQLPDTKCRGTTPWTQGCSLTKATGCVEATWLYDHYRYDYIHMSSPLQDAETYKQDIKNHELWIGINIGCNKGFDAINMGRMLSDDTTTFDHEEWKNR
jgi:hypothetical protein